MFANAWGNPASCAYPKPTSSLAEARVSAVHFTNSIAGSSNMTTTVDAVLLVRFFFSKNITLAPDTQQPSHMLDTKNCLPSAQPLFCISLPRTMGSSIPNSSSLQQTYTESKGHLGSEMKNR
ncbi:hypothetical protein Tco_1170541 [Tanacetum coccineum]